MKALKGKIVVKTDTMPEKIGRIYVPETKQKDRMNTGEVISIGDDVEGIELGNIVFFSKFHGQEFEIEDERHLVLDIDDVDAIIEGDLT